MSNVKSQLRKTRERLQCSQTPVAKRLRSKNGPQNNRDAPSANSRTPSSKVQNTDNTGPPLESQHPQQEIPKQTKSPQSIKARTACAVCAAYVLEAGQWKVSSTGSHDPAMTALGVRNQRCISGEASALTLVSALKPTKCVGGRRFDESR